MIEHGSSGPVLGVELLAALAASTLTGGVVATSPWPLFLALVIGTSAVFLPAILCCLLLGRSASTVALALALMPILAWGWRRMPARQWRTARALGGSRLLVTRVLVLRSLMPFLLAATLLGAAILGVRWRLDSHPAPIVLPDPATATG